MTKRTQAIGQNNECFIERRRKELRDTLTYKADTLPVEHNELNTLEHEMCLVWFSSGLSRRHKITGRSKEKGD